MLNVKIALNFKTIFIRLILYKQKNSNLNLTSILDVLCFIVEMYSDKINSLSIAIFFFICSIQFLARTKQEGFHNQQF